MNELAYLSAALVDPTTLDAHPLGTQHFTGYRREVFLAMKRLHTSGVPFDTTVLSQEAPKAWKAVGVDISCHDGLPSVAGYYAEKLKSEAVAREIAGIETIIQHGLADNKDPHDIRKEIESALSNITVSSGATHAKDIVHSAMRMLDKGRGTPFGLMAIDKIFLGFNPGDLVIIAARPGMGKSALAGCLADYHARKQKVLIFSLEMTKEQWICRLACTVAKVSYEAVVNKKLSNTEIARLLSAMQEISTYNLVIDETPAINISDLRAIVRKEKPAITIVDYLQLVTANSENRFQEVSDISRQLKTCAKESGTAVVALSQLSRALESRNEKRPVLSDLRESGQIEQDADVIMFLYRESQYCEACKLGKCNDPHYSLAEVDIAKQRNGKTGVAYLRWLGDFMQFADKEDYR